MAVDKLSLSNKSYQTWWFTLLLLPTFSDRLSGVCLVLEIVVILWYGGGQGDFDGGADGDVVVEGGKTPHGSVYSHCEIPSHALNIKFKSSHCLLPSQPYHVQKYLHWNIKDPQHISQLCFLGKWFVVVKNKFRRNKSKLDAAALSSLEQLNSVFIEFLFSLVQFYIVFVN